MNIDCGERGWRNEKKRGVDIRGMEAGKKKKSR